MPHALLIHATEGQGEFEFGLQAAQSLLCENLPAEGSACGKCLACGWFLQGNHPDFRLLVPESIAQESASDADPARKERRSEQIRIEQVRELSPFLGVGSHRAGVRAILIYPADSMNANTQNALLKALEEPPPGTVFLLVTTRLEGLLPTVRSRCLKFNLPPPDGEKALAWLKGEGVRHAEAALARSGGAPLGALRAVETESDRSRLLEALTKPDFDPIALVEAASSVPVGELVGWLQRWSHDLALARVSARVRYHPDHEAAIAELARGCEATEISSFQRRLAQARALAGHPLNAKLFAEDLLLAYQRLVSASAKG